jgi:hypothetical protein
LLVVDSSAAGFVAVGVPRSNRGSFLVAKSNVVERVQTIAKECRATKLKISQSEDERLLFWSGHKAAFSRNRPHLGRLLLHGRNHPARSSQ